MANLSATRVKHATLVAATADTVTFATNWSAVEVLNRGTVYISVRLDGTAPVIDADDTEVVAPGSAVVLDNPNPTAVPVVKLISSGTPAYSVRGIA